MRANNSPGKTRESFGPLHDMKVLQNLWHFRIGCILSCGQGFLVFSESLNGWVPTHVVSTAATVGRLVVLGNTECSLKMNLTLCTKNEI